MGVALVYWRWRRVQLELEAEMEAAGGLVALGFEGGSTTGDGGRACGVVPEAGVLEMGDGSGVGVGKCHGCCWCGGGQH